MNIMIDGFVLGKYDSSFLQVIYIFNICKQKQALLKNYINDSCTKKLLKLYIISKHAT